MNAHTAMAKKEYLWRELRRSAILTTDVLFFSITLLNLIMNFCFHLKDK